MTDAEIQRFVEARRTAVMVSLGKSGQPHAIAMWYGVIDGAIWFETKAKSQKVVNLRRDPRLTVLIEDGLTYDTLRGVSFEGQAAIVEEPDALWSLGVNVFERYHGPYTEAVKPLVEAMMHNRVAVRLDVERTRSWDHRKLGLPAMEIGGTTAPQAK